MSEWQRWKGIMKCYPFEEKRLAKWTPPYVVQPKYDGVRCRAMPLESGHFILLSSEENVIYSVPHINEEFHRSMPRYEYDGELYCHGMSFEEIVSITSRTVNLHDDRANVQFHLFDIVNDKSQLERLSMLNKLETNQSVIKKSPFWICNDLDDIMRTFDHLIELNYEGIIVRHLAAPYERKRSRWVMKFKPKKEDFYEILSYNEEISKDGIQKASLGSLVLLSGDGESFNVGTGFTDEQRHDLWKRRDNLIGKTVRVQYQHLTTGKKVPRFPVFMEVIDGHR